MSTITRIGQKAVVDDEGTVSGWLAPFGGPFGGKDLDGEYFSQRTDFGLDYYPTIPVLFGHGGDPEVGAAKVGEITVKEIRDQGLWVEGHLDRQSEYYAAIRELAGKGDMYWSSGSLAHLVKRNAKTGEIKQWPVAEATLTLTPANPAAEAAVKMLETLKQAAIVADDSFVTSQADPETETAADDAVVEVVVNTKKMDPQTLHDLSIAMGAACPDAGKEAAIPPAPVLAPAGDDVERLTVSDLAGLKESLIAVALSEVRRLTG